jgi:hypothetical protein
MYSNPPKLIKLLNPVQLAPVRLQPGYTFAAPVVGVTKGFSIVMLVPELVKILRLSPAFSIIPPARRFAAKLTELVITVPAQVAVIAVAKLALIAPQVGEYRFFQQPRENLAPVAFLELDFSELSVVIVIFVPERVAPITLPVQSKI